MKKSILIILIGTFSAFVSCKNQESTFDWLVGNWQRINANSDEKTFEIWKKISAKKYEGIGFTLKENDTIFKENLTLLKEKNQWIYKVEGVHGNPVLFPLKDFTGNSFKARNDVNDFPKIIVYKFEDKNLKARIANDEKEVLFVFEKNRQ